MATTVAVSSEKITAFETIALRFHELIEDVNTVIARNIAQPLFSRYLFGPHYHVIERTFIIS